MVYPTLFVGLLGYTNDIVLCTLVALFNIALFGGFITTIWKSREDRVLLAAAACYFVSLIVNIGNWIFVGLLFI